MAIGATLPDDDKEAEPKKTRKPRVPAKSLISPEQIAQLLLLVDSIVAFSQNDENLRKLWDIPQEEVMLVAEPASRFIGKRATEKQRAIAENFDLIFLASAIFGVYGTRILKHAQYNQVIKARRATGFTYPTGAKPAADSRSNGSESGRAEPEFPGATVEAAFGTGTGQNPEPGE